MPQHDVFHRYRFENDNFQLENEIGTDSPMKNVTIMQCVGTHICQNPRDYRMHGFYTTQYQKQTVCTF